MAVVVCEEALLREPNLWIPHKKPVGNVKLDTTHHLARGLTNAWVFTEGTGIARDIVRGENWGSLSPDSGATWEVSDRGRVIHADTNNDSFLSERANKVLVPYSIAFSWKKHGADPANFRYFWYSNNAGHSSFNCNPSATTFQISLKNLTLGDGASYTDFIDGNWHSAVTTGTSSTRHDMYLDNKHHAWTTTAITAQATADWLAVNGRDDSPARFSGGDMVYCYVYDRVITEAEVGALHNDPYQMLIPI